MKRQLFVLEKLIVPGKIIGIIFLTYHLFTAPLKLEPVWILIYLGITAILGLLFIGFLWIVEKLMPAENDDSVPSDLDMAANHSLRAINDLVKKQPWQLLLIPGEDGLFFLPLLYISKEIHPVSAIIASLLFAAAHLGGKPPIACLATFIISVMVCIFVLPHGILAVVIGHLIVDLSIFAMLPSILKKFQNKWETHYEDIWGNDFETADRFFFDDFDDLQEWEENSEGADIKDCASGFNFEELDFEDGLYHKCKAPENNLTDRLDPTDPN